MTERQTDRESNMSEVGHESQQILVPIDGLPMAKNCSVTRFREVTSYIPVEEDVFVCSYHKSGTTWLQYMVWCLGNPDKLDDIPYVHEMMLDYGPRIEQLGIKKSKEMSAADGVRRHFKTHLPFGYIPYNERAKYLYAMRSPFDVCKSYYNMLKQMPQFYGFKDGDFDDFFKDFIHGHNDCGSYFDHIVSWIKNMDKLNILFLKYEEIRSNHEDAIIKIGNFLGSVYASSANDPKIRKQVMEKTSFDFMKTLPFVLPSSFEVIMRTGVINVGRNLDLVNTGDYRLIDFFKVGKSGYAKKEYTEEQKVLMNQRIREKFADYPDLIRQFVV